MKSKGFTLIELLAAIVIMALLIGIAIPVYFNISKGAKENEYTSKKNYLESLAERYAEENNVNTTTKISVSRLIASGYTSAENYVDDGDIPFISNPKDSEDNLACRVITFNLDNYDYKATISEESDCSFAESDVEDAKMGIKVFEFSDNKIGEQIGSLDSVYDWTNKDIIIVVNPEYENIKNISISTAGDTKIVDSAYMLTNPKKGDEVNLNNVTNVIVISADRIAKRSVNVALELESTIKSTSIEVRIDKESPSVDSQKFSGWTSTEKGAMVFLSDGAGSGSKGVYVSETSNFNDRDSSLIEVDKKEEFVHIKEVNGKNLQNKRYYLWAEDNAGNISSVASYIDISNIDDEKPKVDSIQVISQKDYKSRYVTVKITASDVGAGVTYACVVNGSNKGECNWQPFGNGSYSGTLELPSTEGSGQTYTIYAFVRDAVGNVSDSQGLFKAASYTMYRRCQELAYSAWTPCSAVCNGGTQTRVATDKYLSGVCDAPNTIQACNTQDCCSSVVLKSTTKCDKGCATGNQVRTFASAYDGRICKTDTVKCNQNVDCCGSLNYGSWSSCPSCGAANKTRTMTSKYTGQSCGIETQSCNAPDCCSKVNYGSWSACSAPCGGGTQSRTKTSAYNGQSCGSESQACGGKKVVATSVCSTNCGTGQYRRDWTSTYNNTSCGPTWDGGACSGTYQIGKEWKYTSNGSLTVPCTGEYYIELYGAQGGGDGGAHGGKGANLDVSVRLAAGTSVSFVTGGVGGTSHPTKASNTAGGANGGGESYWSGGGGGRTEFKINGTTVAAAAGGGGATHGIAGQKARCSGSSDTSGSWKGKSTSSYKNECQKDAGAGGAGFTHGGAGGTHEGCSGQKGGYGGISGHNSSVKKELCSTDDRAGNGYATISINSW